MEFSEEWRSVFSLLSSTVLPSSSVEVGPVLFHPVPNSLRSLFTSHNLCPATVNPPPQLSHSRFLQTTTYPDCPILRSTAASVTASFGSTCDDYPTDFRHNLLQTLRCPNGQIITFFPTGSNLDQVGFIVLSAGDPELKVSLDPEGNIFTSPKRFNHRIVQLCVSHVSYHDYDSDGVEGLINVGYLVACTLYSVYWFCLRIRDLNSDSERPVLVYLGSKLFRSCAVAHACWNSHSSDECLVLLENGELYLFCIGSASSSSNLNGLGVQFQGSRLRVPWEELGETTSGWFSCAFSWHGRILILANSSAVFLVDLRCGKYDVTCLLKTGEMDIEDTVGSDRFIAFAKGGPDEFYFAVASQHWVYLCDVRKPSTPVLQWAHHLQEPYYMTFSPLSDLKLESDTNEHGQYSEGSFAIILGSFWNCNFTLFYGGFQSSPGQNFVDGLSDEVKSIYAWVHPSHISFSGQDCLCGTCLLKEDLAKAHLPEWIQWQQKKELVMGFSILDRDLCCQLSEPDEYGGFTLVRMMSCGKLESQRYSPSFSMPRMVEGPHKDLPLHCRDPLMCFTDDEKYKFQRKFKYRKLEYLYRNLNGTLTNAMFKRLEKISATVSDEQHSCMQSHQLLCKNLRALGLKQPKECDSMIDLFRDVGIPASVYEVSLEKMWAGLPTSILEFAFSNYEEVLEVMLDHKKVSLDFLAVPDQIQLPPFLLRNPSYRANKWSRGVRREDGVVGPAIPLPALRALKEIDENGSTYLKKVREFSFERELSQQCETVMEIAESVAVKQSDDKVLDEDGVSKDREQNSVASEEACPYFSYKLSTLSVEPPYAVTMQKEPINEEKRSSFMVAKLSDHERTNCCDDKSVGQFNQDGMELFADLCPVDLRFDNPDLSFGTKELQIFQKLKKQFSKWQNEFSPYVDFKAQLKRQKRYP